MYIYIYVCIQGAHASPPTPVEEKGDTGEPNPFSLPAFKILYRG